MKRISQWVAAAVAAVATTAPMMSEAALVLRLDDSATAGMDKLVIDGGSGDADGLADGKVVYLGPAGNWSINVSTGTGNAGLSAFGINLNSVNVSGSGAGVLTIEFTETDMVFGSAGPLVISGDIGGVSGGNFSYALYADDLNAQFGSTATIFSGAGAAGVFTRSGSGSVSLADPFSLTLSVSLDHLGVAGKSSSFDFSSEVRGGAVPEPPSLALAGLALFAAAGIARRRRPAGKRGQ